MDLSSGAIQALLFAFFSGLTAILAAVIGPTYDNLLVPELAASALFPALPPVGGSGGSFLGIAASFSSYLVVNIVDPAVALLGVTVGVAYLARSFLGRWAGRAEPMLARLVLAVVFANFSIPIAGAILDLAGATYPVITGFDNGAWEHWVNLAGIGGISFSWDNGILAFVLSFALFTLVLLLAIAVALRDALLAVLLVLLPLLTLLWPIPALAPLARRAWTLFGEAAFLPCVLVIPLELAVGASSDLLLLGFLTVSLASPSLLSVAGAHLTSVGFPSGGSVVTGGVQRGLASGSQVSESLVRPAAALRPLGAGGRQLLGQSTRALSAGFPASVPLLAAEFLGRGTAHLVRHLPGTGTAGGKNPRFPPVRGRPARGNPRG